MEGAKSPYVEVELKTGVLVDNTIHKSLFLREMAGQEEDILASKKMSVTKKLSTVMANCIIKFGSIEDRQTINSLVEKMVISDRVYLLMQLRAISLGNEYAFKSECPQCSHVDSKVFDLSKIEITDAPSADKLFKEVTLPSGLAIRLKVGTGQSEEVIEKSSNEDNAATMALFTRIDHIGDQKPTLFDVKKMSLKDRQALRKEIESFEGTVDDSYKASCPKCGHEYEGEVPMNGLDFFFP